MSLPVVRCRFTRFCMYLWSLESVRLLCNLRYSQCRYHQLSNNQRQGIRWIPVAVVTTPALDQMRKPERGMKIQNRDMNSQLAGYLFLCWVFVCYCASASPQYPPLSSSFVSKLYSARAIHETGLASVVEKTHFTKHELRMGKKTQGLYHMVPDILRNFQKWSGEGEPMSSVLLHILL